MKQVRFDTPRRSDPRLRSHAVSNGLGMHESSDCQEPRPLTSSRTLPTPIARYPPELPVPYSIDPLERFELSDSTPYAARSKTVLPTWEKRLSGAFLPSSDLELSRLDSTPYNLASDRDRRHSVESTLLKRDKSSEISTPPNELPQALKLPELVGLPNVFASDLITKVANKFNDDERVFIHTDKPVDATVPWGQKESVRNDNDNPLKTKVTLPNNMYTNTILSKNHWKPNFTVQKHCSCHECKQKNNQEIEPPNYNMEQHYSPYFPPVELEPSLYSPCVPSQPVNCHQLSTNRAPYCSQQHSASLRPRCCEKRCHCEPASATPINPVRTKSKTIDRYERKLEDSVNDMEVEKQANIIKEKREPTVNDLFKIIKLQSEQLKLLQDQVQHLVAKCQPNLTDNTSTQFRPVQNFIQEHVSVETMDDNRHTISIGVMTSFEVVHTSTVSKERLGKNSAQIQCNRSQVSLKEVVTAAEQGNFLDGIAHVNQCFGPTEKNVEGTEDHRETYKDQYSTPIRRGSPENGSNEKTFNEMSLCNFQMDNAMTPQLSPDQTIYLDVKDYSDSDNDESRVGWTYYNKVMSHVNEMLQESCVPSSAGALHRRAVAAAEAAAAGGGARCTRLHVDRTDVSVTTSKRVTFGQHSVVAEPARALLGASDTSLHMNRLAAKCLLFMCVLSNCRVTFGQHPAAAETARALPGASDTSLQMNRLAAKYLRSRGAAAPPAPPDMSLATRKYMEQHNLLGGGVGPTDPSKFLDITALKRQPKLL